MSRTPAQDDDAIDRHNQYLMKIKRWIALDMERDEDERQKIQELLVEIMGLIYKRTPAVKGKPAKASRKVG